MKGHHLLLIFLFGIVPFSCSKATTEVESENFPPEILSLKAVPQNLQVGESARLTCTARDRNGDELHYRWETSGLGYLLGSGPTITFSAPACCVGLNEITVTVSDPAGARDSRKIVVSVVDGGL